MKLKLRKSKTARPIKDTGCQLHGKWRSNRHGRRSLFKFISMVVVFVGLNIAKRDY